MIHPLPTFDGEVYLRPDGYQPKMGGDAILDPYTIHSYQYATSSVKPGAMMPSAIIYAANESDIILAIEYARENKLSIAVRSGGHHYWGHSSTSGNNIQLDMSGFTQFSYDSIRGMVTCGVGVQLGDLAKKLAQLGMFVPHGQCARVCVGGHVQSGGFSPHIGRSFGLFHDQVEEFRIITADSKVRNVTKPRADDPDEFNDELWYAVLGSSPGSFGVLVYVIFKPFLDCNHSNSRAQTYYMTYTKEAYTEVLSFITELNDDDDLAADFNAYVITLGHCSPLRRPNIDSAMIPFSEFAGARVQIVALFVVWTNLDGGPLPESIEKFFMELDNRMAPYMPGPILQFVARIMASLFGEAAPPSSDWKLPISLSKVSQILCFSSVRVNDNPYCSAVWIGDRIDTKSNGFIQFAVDLVEESNKHPGVYPTHEYGPMGGRFSKNKSSQFSSVSWRNNITMMAMHYNHYDNTTYLGGSWPEPKESAKLLFDNAEKNAIGPSGCVSSKPMHWVAFPKDHDDMDSVREYYFETEEQWVRVLKLKDLIDPDGIFSANLSSIGAGTIDQSLKRQRL